MILIKTPQQIEGIRKSCQLLAQIMEEVKKAVRVGVTTAEINRVTEQLIAAGGAKPAFKGYRAYPGGVAFPSSICTSVNEVVVHGPAVSDDPLKEGDIIGLDLGVNLHGYFSDMAVTLPVGKISKEIQQLLNVTRDSLYNGIAPIKAGGRVKDISQAIEKTIRPHGYGIIRDFVGHGVGLQVHEDPRIPNYVSREFADDLAVTLKEGMVIAIEPMITAGSEDVDVGDDGWTVSTLDGSYAAHFEHTILVTSTGYEILTELKQK
jgi:methionyl aminopeptidase